MGHCVGLTSLAFQPKLRERFTRPKRHVTFCFVGAKLPYPAHTRDLDEDEDVQPLVRSDRNADSEGEDDNPLVQPTSRKEPVEERRESVAGRRVPTQVRRRKPPPV